MNAEFFALAFTAALNPKLLALDLLLIGCAVTTTWRPGQPGRPSALRSLMRQAQSWNQRRRALKQVAPPMLIPRRGDELAGLLAGSCLCARSVIARVAAARGAGAPLQVGGR